MSDFMLTHHGAVQWFFATLQISNLLRRCVLPFVLDVKLSSVVVPRHEKFFWTAIFRNLELQSMGGLVIGRADCRAISARRRTTAHFALVSPFLCTGYVVNKSVSCVLMNVILVTMK
jgi:hypothetical protein